MEEWCALRGNSQVLTDCAPQCITDPLHLFGIESERISVPFYIMECVANEFRFLGAARIANTVRVAPYTRQPYLSTCVPCVQPALLHRRLPLTVVDSLES